MKKKKYTCNPNRTETIKSVQNGAPCYKTFINSLVKPLTLCQHNITYIIIQYSL